MKMRDIFINTCYTVDLQATTLAIRFTTRLFTIKLNLELSYTTKKFITFKIFLELQLFRQ